MEDKGRYKRDRPRREKTDYEHRYSESAQSSEQSFGGPSVSSHHLRGKEIMIEISNQVTPDKRGKIKKALKLKKNMSASIEYKNLDTDNLPLFLKKNPDDSIIHILANGVQYLTTHSEKNRPYLVYVPIDLKDPYLVRNIIKLSFDRRMQAEAVSPSKITPVTSSRAKEDKSKLIPANSARAAPRVNRKPFGSSAYTIWRLENGYGDNLNTLIENNTDSLLELLEKNIIQKIKSVEITKDGKVHIAHDNLPFEQQQIITHLLTNEHVQKTILAPNLRKDFSQKVTLNSFELWFAIFLIIERPHIGHKFDHALTQDDSSENTYVQKMRLNGCQTSLGSLALSLNKNGVELHGQHSMTYQKHPENENKLTHLAAGEVDLNYEINSTLKIGQTTKASVFFLPVNGVMNRVTKAVVQPYLDELESPSLQEVSAPLSSNKMPNSNK